MYSGLSGWNKWMINRSHGDKSLIMHDNIHY